MSTTGRFFVRDPRSGRRFCVEVLSTRSQKMDEQSFSNGGIDQVRGGSIRPEDSVIRPENGFKNIIELAPGTDPMSAIDALLAQDP